MKFKTLAIPALAAVLAVAPFTSANAHDYYWHGRGFSHGGPGPVLGLLGAAVVGVAAIATLPIRAIAEPAYVDAPPPPQPYYAPQAAYYPPQPQVVYAQPYYARPVYYAPRPVYYYR